MRIQYQENELSAVMQHFIKGFEPTDGERVCSGEWFIDVAKGRVVFKLYLEPVVAAPAPEKP